MPRPRNLPVISPGCPRLAPAALGALSFCSAAVSFAVTFRARVGLAREASHRHQVTGSMPGRDRWRPACRVRRDPRPLPRDASQRRGSRAGDRAEARHRAASGFACSPKCVHGLIRMQSANGIEPTLIKHLLE
jgi:hypothetical protein